MAGITVAAVCMECIPGGVEQNLATIERLTWKAASAGASLVCFPEFSATGYPKAKADAVAAAELSGAISERLQETAAASGCTVMVGLVEAGKNGELYAGHLVVSPQGLVGRHLKTHLPPPEDGIFSEFSDFGLFRQGSVSYGIQLCYETHFPELSTLMALRGADILFFPHASPRGSPGEKLNSWLRHLPARAFDNALYVIACNQAGFAFEDCRFPGAAVVLDPQGRLLGSYAGSAEHVLTVNLDLEALRATRSHRMKYFLPNRRPAMYAGLAEPSGSRKL